MNNEEQILTTLQKLLEVQERTLSIQTQVFESQQKALANQQAAIKNQLATGRIYRISLTVLAVIMTLAAYYLFNLER